MSLADRPSDRVTNGDASPLVKSEPGSRKGAEGERLRNAYELASVPRLSRRGLGQLAAALSERETAIVRSVADFRFLTATHLQQLHFVDSQDGRIMTRPARRTFTRLTEERLLRRLERRIGGLRAGSASYVYALGPIGDRLLGLSGPRLRHREPSLILLTHCLSTADVFVGLRVAALARQIEIVGYETEPECWRSVPTVTGTSSLRPDLLLVVGRGDLEWHWFVEVDLATEHAPVIRSKCRQYQAYYLSGVEQEVRGVFPRVAWLTPTDRRAAELRRIIENDGEVQSALFVVGTIAEAPQLLAPGDPT